MDVSRKRLVTREDLGERTQVFRDRAHAGQILAEMLSEVRARDAVVLGIPAGGVPVAAEVARRLGLPLGVAVVSKITLPWSTESGYGAIAFDGTMRLNEEMIQRLDLRPEQIERGRQRTARKVERRVAELAGGRGPDTAGRVVIVTDDGIASGFTLSVAVEALRKTRPAAVLVAVPTGHRRAVERLAQKVDRLYCANLRSGLTYAVADAYRHWHDVDEAEVHTLLRLGAEPPRTAAAVQQDRPEREP